MWQVVRQVLAQAWQQFAGQSLAVLPNVLAGLLFLVIGVGAGHGRPAGSRSSCCGDRPSSAARTGIGLTSWLERAGILSATAVLVRLVQVVFALMTAALVLYALDAALASDLTKRFFLYLPDLAVGIAIFVVGILASRVVGRQRAHRRGEPRPAAAARLLAALTRGGIVVLSSAVALDHLGIGRAIVPSALLILLGGVTLACGARRRPRAAGTSVGRWIDDRLGQPAPSRTPTRSSTGSRHRAAQARGRPRAALTSPGRSASGSTWRSCRGRPAPWSPRSARTRPAGPSWRSGAGGSARAGGAR